MLNELNILTMKKMIFALITMLTITMSASAMSYEQARNEALFLTDKMAYELNLTDAQYEAAYEINLDYLMGVTTYDDVFGTYWERRNLDLSYILYRWQWDAFRAATYFYRPLYWESGYWHFGVYARYPRRDYFYFGRPQFYATYRGGHAWHVAGGRGYYYGRSSHFRPALRSRSTYFGMRNSYDRGDYRRHRTSSSTRYDRSYDRRDNQKFGNRDRGNSRKNDRGYNRSRSIGINNNSRSYEQNNSNFGGRSSSNSNDRFGSNWSTSPAQPRRSIGAGNRNNTPTRSTEENSRSNRSSDGSSRTTNSHGHFGGAR
jgi:hypothetical protein